MKKVMKAVAAIMLMTAAVFVAGCTKSDDPINGGNNNGGNGGGDNGGLNGHTYVDLGLPSGTLWATTNVGADAVFERGACFAWAETESKDVFNGSTYKYMYEGKMTKYNLNDGLLTLLSSDDAATVNWGSGWRTPTYLEWDELMYYCTWERSEYNGVKGVRFTAPNGVGLFLPSNIDYWTSTLHSRSIPNSRDSFQFAWAFAFDYYGGDYGSNGTIRDIVLSDNVHKRFEGLAVRPVRAR